MSVRLLPSRVFHSVIILLIAMSVSSCSTFSRDGTAASQQTAAPMPAVQAITQDGLNAWLIEDHSVPVVSVNFLFKDAGSAANPAGKEGLANLTASLLTEGAGDMDSTAFQAALEDKAIRLSFNAGRDSTTATLQTLKENLDEAVQLATMAMIQPRIDRDALARVKQQTAATIAWNQQTPDAIANQAWWKAAYPDHPYGQPAEGTLESLKAITRKDVLDFTRNRFARDTLLVGISGDVTADEARTLLTNLFRSLPLKASPLPKEVTTQPAPRKGGKEPIIIHRPIPQATAVFGHAGIRRDDPEYFTAVLLNHTLGGGGFSSRLMEEVREKRGLTYGISTSLAPISQEGLLLGQIASDNGKMRQALDLTHEVWASLAKDGVTDKELKDARDYNTGSFPLQLDSTRKLSSLLVAMQYYNLGQDYLNRREGLLRKVTQEDIKAMAARLLKQEDLLVVIVGDKEKLGGK
jgi:zinc protease